MRCRVASASRACRRSCRRLRMRCSPPRASACGNCRSQDKSWGSGTDDRFVSSVCPTWITLGLSKAMRRFCLLLVYSCVALRAQGGETEKLAPYYPTPETIVEKMLQLGGLKAGEKMYDLGSGDGRIVITAARKFHAEAVGVELDKDLCKQSAAKILKLGLEKNARIVNGDLLKQNYTSADLVTVYLLPDSINNKVQPLLDK